MTDYIELTPGTFVNPEHVSGVSRSTVTRGDETETNAHIYLLNGLDWTLVGMTPEEVIAKLSPPKYPSWWAENAAGANSDEIRKFLQGDTGPGIEDEE